MSNKTFGFGQRVNYNGHNGVSLVTGKAITDPDGNVADDWWWVATPAHHSIMTHAKNIEPIEQPHSPLDDNEIERLVNSQVEERSPFGTARVSMSDRQKDIVRMVLRYVRQRYSVSERSL